MEWDYKEAQKLEEHAIEYREYKVNCDECNKQTDGEEYNSSAAQAAYYMDFRVVKINEEESYVFCKDCRDKGVPERWAKEEI